MLFRDGKKILPPLGIPVLATVKYPKQDLAYIWVEVFTRETRSKMRKESEHFYWTPLELESLPGAHVEALLKHWLFAIERNTKEEKCRQST